MSDIVEAFATVSDQGDNNKTRFCFPLLIDSTFQVHREPAAVMLSERVW